MLRENINDKDWQHCIKASGDFCTHGNPSLAEMVLAGATSWPFKAKIFLDFDPIPETPQFFEIPNSTAVAYIDPSQPENGDGTFKSPFNNWQNVDISSTSPYSYYLQKAGTVAELPGDFTIFPERNSRHFGAYGYGTRPVIKKINTVTGTRIVALYFNSRSGSSVSNIRFETTDCSGIYVFVRSTASFSGFTVSNCAFLANSTGESESFVAGVTGYMNPTQYLQDIEIKGCQFASTTSLEKMQAVSKNVYGVYFTSSGALVKGFKFKNNTLKNIPGTGFQLTSWETDYPKDTATYGIQVENNYFENVWGSQYSNNLGASSIEGYESYIKHNTMINAGHPTIPHINAIQGQRMNGIEVAYNVIHGTTTSKPDGAGIILDWALSDRTMLTINCKVHHNIISGCADGAGISAYVAQDCLIYSNYIYDCAAGISVGKNFSTGNKAFNNTIENCAHALRVVDYPDGIGSSFALVANNIFQNCERFAHIANKSKQELGGGNYIYKYAELTNAPDMLIIHSTDVLDVDPLTVDAPSKEAWRLEPVSPCIKTGVSGLSVYGFVDQSVFGLNDRALSSPPTIGAWQP